jgi:hypothetical protein
MRIWSSFATLVIVGVLLAVAHGESFCQSSDYFSVTVREGQSLRGIAEEYLNDPDLWTEILSASNIESAADVRPGTRLRIPVTQVSRANRALEQSLQSTQKATAAGARIFAPSQIATAYERRDNALELRKQSDWDGCYDEASQASQFAEEALGTCMGYREIKAEAILTDRNGTVQGRKDVDPIWSTIRFKDVLVERQKVRTLSASHAEITFRDESRIRLNENSQAVIQRMRLDLLDNREKTSVTLLEGDVYALLGASRQKKEFDLDMPGIDAQVDVASSNFWVGRSQTSAMVANYDKKEIGVTAGGKKVTLSQNSGIAVDNRRALARRVRLLGRPPLAAPRPDELVVEGQVRLAWAGVDGAAGYWAEVATDRFFAHTIVNSENWDLPESSVSLETLEEGTYYWRVAAVDSLGFPGVKSLVRRFYVTSDTYAPFLAITAPDDGKYVRENRVVVAGEVESGIELTIDGERVAVDSKGMFSKVVQLEGPVTDIEIVATDRSGIRTRRVRNVRYVPDTPAPFDIDSTRVRTRGGALVSPSEELTLSGTTLPGASLIVKSDSTTILLHTSVGPDSLFRVNIPLTDSRKELKFEVKAPSEFVTSHDVAVERDFDGPAISLDSPPPARTREAVQILSGTFTGGAELRLNQRMVDRSGDRFELKEALQEGLNSFELEALDGAGNRSALRFDIVRDSTPPLFQTRRVESATIDGHPAVLIRVKASDSSGLRSTAAYVAKVGDEIVEGVLKLTGRDETVYEDILYTGVALGSIRLTTVDLEDTLGNARRIDIGR